MRTLAKRESIDQAQSINESAQLPGVILKTLAPFWTTPSWGVGFLKAMLQTYAEDEFLRYIAAKSSERTR